MDYWLTGILLLCTQIPFYFSKDKNKK